MNYQVRSLRKPDTLQASTLDKKWFGEYGITQEELNKIIDTYPDGCIALLEKDVLHGFVVFEVLENGTMPKDYIIGKMLHKGKALFIQQFTTDQNYSEDMKSDRALLEAIESKAIGLGCSFIAEALDQNHAFRKERNSKHDAFGFYRQSGYSTDSSNLWIWQPKGMLPITCLLYTKKL